MVHSASTIASTYGLILWKQGTLKNSVLKYSLLTYPKQNAQILQLNQGRHKGMPVQTSCRHDLSKKKHFSKVSYHKNEVSQQWTPPPTSPKTTKRWPNDKKCQVTTISMFKMQLHDSINTQRMSPISLRATVTFSTLCYAAVCQYSANAITSGDTERYRIHSWLLSLRFWTLRPAFRNTAEVINKRGEPKW